MPVFLYFVIGDEPLQVLDGDRLIEVRPPAVRFAGTDTDPAEGPGHADALPDRGQRFREPLFADLLHVTGNIEAAGADADAGGGHGVPVPAFRRFPAFRNGIGKGLREILQRVEDGVHAGLTDGAFGPLPYSRRQVPDTGDIFLPALSGGDLLEPVAHQPRADAAGETFSAGLRLHGLRVPGAHVDDVHLFIAQNDAVPAHEGLDPFAGPELRRKLDVSRLPAVLLRDRPVVDQLFLPGAENDFFHPFTCLSPPARCRCCRWRQRHPRPFALRSSSAGRRD